MYGKDAASIDSDSPAGSRVEGFSSNSVPITTMAPNPTTLSSFLSRDLVSLSLSDFTDEPRTMLIH